MMFDVGWAQNWAQLIVGPRKAARMEHPRASGETQQNTYSAASLQRESMCYPPLVPPEKQKASLSHVPSQGLIAHASDACLRHLLQRTAAIVNSVREVGTDPFSGGPADSARFRRPASISQLPNYAWRLRNIEALASAESGEASD
jgi:hypothetical protein